MHFLNFSENMSQILDKISQNHIFHKNGKSGDLHTMVIGFLLMSIVKANIGFSMLLMTVFELFNTQFEKNEVNTMQNS